MSFFFVDNTITKTMEWKKIFGRAEVMSIVKFSNLRSVKWNNQRYSRNNLTKHRIPTNWDSIANGYKLADW